MKRFQRSRNNVIIAGVCGGLGEYFNIDPLLFRIIFVLLFFTGSLGGWIYLLLWLLAPIADTPSHKANRHRSEPPVEDVDFTYVDEPTGAKDTRKAGSQTDSKTDTSSHYQK